MNKIAATGIVVFPQSGALSHPGLKRVHEAVSFRFGDATPRYAAVDPPDFAAAREAGFEPIEFAAAESMPGVDTWIIALGFLPVFHGDGGFEKVSPPGSRLNREGKKLYFTEPDGFLHPLQIAADGTLDSPSTSDFDGHLDGNIFSRLGTKSFRGAAYFFPYNGFYVGHPSAFGPIDEFGFRNAHNLAELATRPSDHLIVATFGGSTVWSPCCLQHETFSSQLEEMLRERLGDQDKFKMVSVVNFGVSGHTVLNEMITWLLFCHKLKPEIVIGHDGFNDLANGLQTDPDLLNRNDITYMSAMEQWGQHLMSAPDVPLTQSGEGSNPIRIMSGPQAVARAYLTRKRQFSDLVEKSGAQFLWGIQPAWFGKSAAPAEYDKFAKIRALSPQLEPMYRALPQLYDLVRDAMAKSAITNPVDVHGEFGNFSVEDDLFVDHAHLNPSGEAKIAEIYTRAIIDRVLPAKG